MATSSNDWWSAYGARPWQQRGLTMVELMVSITIGLLIVGAVLYVYLGSRGAYRTSKSTSRIQEAGHFGLDAILNDTRQAGFIGCGSRRSLEANGQDQMSVRQIANPPLPFLTTGPNQVVQAVSGYSAGNWVEPAGLLVPQVAGDALVLNVVGSSSLMMVKEPDPTIPAIYVANNCGNKIQQDAYVVTSNCTMATVLRVSNKPTTGAAACPVGAAVVPGGVEIDHGATDTLGKTVNGNLPDDSTALVASLKPRVTMASMPSVQVFDEVTYYVGQLAGRPAPALYRYSATAGPGSPEEIIDHVENLRVVYGIGGGPNVVFQTADQINAANPPAWPNVISVCVSLIVAGDELGAVDAPQTLTFGCPGTPTPVTVVAPDTRLRQVFTATAALRDRMN